MKLFNFNQQQDQAPKQHLETRLEIFLDKLTQKADELYKDAKASAQSIADEDQDSFKRGYHQFKAGIISQFTGIIQKGSHTFQTQVMPAASGLQQISLSQLFNTWQSQIVEMLNTVFEGVQERNLEQEYAQAMAEFNQHKANLHCTQCGGKLVIDQFYHLTTYIPCPYCKTQNTFNPGSKAKMIEFIAWPLAVLRCSPLKKIHKTIREENGLEAGLESYQQYAKAINQQMDQILPGMEKPHQELYQRLMHDYKAFGVDW